jgi:hypothetical protein
LARPLCSKSILIFLFRQKEWSNAGYFTQPHKIFGTFIAGCRP